MKIIDPEDPRLLRIHHDRLIKRDIDQLLGICEFSLLDGHIDQDEADQILLWLENHRACLSAWPAYVIYDRLRAMLADGVLDAEEQHELLSLVASFARPPAVGERLPASLPVNQPQPPIQFEKHSFCFTGVFEYGSRADCHAATESRGGTPAKGITKKLHYLVIGNIGSDVWKHTSFGNKIAKAVEYRDSGESPLCIVTETHWVAHLRTE